MLARESSSNGKTELTQNHQVTITAAKNFLSWARNSWNPEIYKSKQLINQDLKKIGNIDNFWEHANEVFDSFDIDYINRKIVFLKKEWEKINNGK